MRYLAIDLGDQRTGLAVGDDETRLVSPAGVVQIPRHRERELLLALTDAARAHEAQAFVIGLPLNMDSSIGPRAALARAFAGKLAEASSLQVYEQDERLTSAEADWQMSGSGLTHKQKKARRDALASAAILRDFLASTNITRTECVEPPREAQPATSGWGPRPRPAVQPPAFPAESSEKES